METQPGSVPVSGTQTPRAPLQQQEEPGHAILLKYLVRFQSARVIDYHGSKAKDEPSDELTCYICMEQATNSVVTPCGHIFCWSCMYKWLEDRARPCPVCNIMVGLGSIIPVHGGGTRSSRESSIPPRPCGSADAAVDGNIVLSPAFRDAEQLTVTVRSSWMRETLRRSSLPEATLRYTHTQNLRSRALEKFRAIRESRPPSSIGWIAEAAASFDPSVRSSADGSRLPHDLSTFILFVLLPQSEYFPGIEDFRVSWWPYYKVLNPRGSLLDFFGDFLESWCKHFYRAWDRAGCLEYPASPGEPQLPTVTGS